MFEKIRSERILLEERKRALKRDVSRRTPAGATKSIISDGQILSDVRLALMSDSSTGDEKRDLLGTIVERVACIAKGAQVTFRQGLFLSHTVPTTSILPIPR